MINEKYSKELLPLSKNRLYASLKDLFQIGSRWAGTEGESKAKQYIFDEFNKIGLEDVQIEEFEYLNFMPVSSELSITSPKSSTFNSASLAYSASGTVEGELIYVGTGSEEEFKTLENLGIDFKGKIILLKSIAPFFAYPLAENRGAAGIVCTADTHPNLMFKNTSKVPVDLNKPPEDHKGSIPGVTFLRKDAEFLLSLLSAGKVEVRLKQQGEYSLRKSWNITGKVKGKEWPEQKILVGGHYDTMPGVPGAWDNAAGCAGLLEVARVFADLKLRRSIIFCAFGCEEIGMWGSSAYTKAHISELDRYAAMITMEPGGSDYFHSLSATPKIMGFASSVAEKECNWRVDEANDKAMYYIPTSDFFPFVQAGVEAIWARDRDMNPYYHTEKDIIEYVDPAKLLGHVTVSGMCAFKLANMPTFPWQG